MINDFFYLNAKSGEEISICLNNYFKLHISLSICNFSILSILTSGSQNVINKSCLPVLRQKNVVWVTLKPLLGGPWGMGTGQRGQSQSLWNQKNFLIKVVGLDSLVIKIHFIDWLN